MLLRVVRVGRIFRERGTMIRAAVGSSTERDTTRAALAAARQVSRGLGGAKSDWAIAFVTPEHAGQLPLLQQALSGVLDTPYVVGCTAAGVLTAGLEVEQGPAVGVLGVASDQLRATPFLFHDEGDRGMTAGIRLGQRVVNSRNSNDLLLVWPDAYHVRPDRLLQGLDAVLGHVPVLGGAASSRNGDPTPAQFCGSESSSAAVSGLRLGWPAEEEDLFEKLAHAGLVSAEMTQTLRRMRGFRNILVHEYGRVDDQIVFEMVNRKLSDFEAFQKEILEVLRELAAKEDSS
jgi:hypothetical protein